MVDPLTPPHTTPFRRGPVSFVRRSARMRPGQERAWDAYAPQYLLDVPHGPAHTSVAEGATLDPVDAFGRRARLIVEIGSGMGHALVHAAAQDPDTDFIGIEVFAAGLARTMQTAADADVRNLRLIEANAPEVLERLLPAACIDELWIFFPDPWAKTKHHKRRLVSPDFIPLAARAVRPGGVVRIATDWEDYAEQAREVFDASAEFDRAFDGHWADRFVGRVLTKFEKRGIQAGRPIRDLTYHRSATV